MVSARQVNGEARATVDGRSGVQRTFSAVGLSLALAIAGCGDEEEPSGPSDQGDIQVEWERGAPEIGTLIKREQLMEMIAKELNTGFKFPRDLPVLHQDCGVVNAQYDGNTGELTMCYELLEDIAQVSEDLSSTNQEFGERVVGTWAYVFFHELGHAMTDMYNLPITGKEEDAVDDFSTILLIEADLAEYAALAADYWTAHDTGMYDQTDFSDEHSLSPQRFYNILCLVYGSDPDKFEYLEQYLSEHRAARCPYEYEQKREAWFTLLAPWVK